MTEPRLAALCAVVAVALLGLLTYCTPALPQDRLQSSKPQGFFGVGHEQFHHFYIGLKNQNGFSCCNDKDCRPTQARWNGETWDVMIDGQWRTMTPMEAYKVLTPDIMTAQGKERPDSQAHICTNPAGSVIYCFLPPASGG